jgi:hypothetical protein
MTVGWVSLSVATMWTIVLEIWALIGDQGPAGHGSAIVAYVLVGAAVVAVLIYFGIRTYRGRCR